MDSSAVLFDLSLLLLLGFWWCCYPHSASPSRARSLFVCLCVHMLLSFCSLCCCCASRGCGSLGFFMYISYAHGCAHTLVRSNAIEAPVTNQTHRLSWLPFHPRLCMPFRLLRRSCCTVCTIFRSDQSTLQAEAEGEEEEEEETAAPHIISREDSEGLLMASLMLVTCRRGCI